MLVRSLARARALSLSLTVCLCVNICMCVCECVRCRSLSDTIHTHTQCPNCHDKLDPGGFSFGKGMKRAEERDQDSADKEPEGEAGDGMGASVSAAAAAAAGCGRAVGGEAALRSELEAVKRERDAMLGRWCSVQLWCVPCLCRHAATDRALLHVCSRR